MQNQRFLQIGIWTVALLSVFVQWHFYAELPARVAVHFNALGKPDSWSSRNNFFLSSSGLMLGLAAFFQLMIHSLPRLPKELINIPNREFWLSRERRPETILRLKRYLLWVAFLTMLFLGGVLYLTTMFNINQARRLGNEFWILFVLYFVAISALTVELLYVFSRKSANSSFPHRS